MSQTAPGAARSPGTLIWAGLRLMRVQACVTAALSSLLASALVQAPLSAAAVVLMMAVVSLVTDGGNALNDYFDRDIDRINARNRPIPRGKVSAREAWWFAVALFAAGIVPAITQSWWCLGIALFNSALLVAYARHSKALGAFKNICVGYLVGSVFLFGAYQPGNVDAVIAVLAACAALATFAREVMKDVEDLAGDERHGARTLGATLGSRGARRLAAAALALAVLLALVPYLLGRTNEAYLALIVLGGVVFAVVIRTSDPARSQHYIMAGSIVELLAFVVGGSILI